MCYNRRAVLINGRVIVLRKLVAVIVLVAAIGAGVLFVLNRSDGEKSSVNESVRQARVERGEMVVSVSATGSIVPKAEAKLTFDLPGKVERVWVEVGDFVRMGDQLAQLNDANLQFSLQQAEAALAAAQAQLNQLESPPRSEEVAISEANLAASQAALDGAQANLQELQSGPDENQVAAAEANLRAVQANLQLAALQRDQVVDGASVAEIAAAEAQVASALVQQKVARDTHDQAIKCTTVKLPNGEKQEICPGLGTFEEQARFNLFATDEALEAAQAQLDQLLADPTQEQVETGDVNVAAAAAQRDAAQAQLDQLRAGASAEQLLAAQANIAASTAQRDAVQAQLDLLLAGNSVHQIGAAQASVDQAQVTLAMAQAELEKVRLLAPLDGLVTTLNVHEQELAPVSLPAATLADVSELQIVVDVDEIDVAQIAEGQDVTIRVDALPFEVISGHVKRIAPAASQVGGVVVYQVIIVLDQADLPLQVGMSATAAITVQQLDDVLLVPNWAIRIDRETGNTFVNLLGAATIEETEVEIGVRGEDASQVLSGLQEGDIVVAGDVVGLRTLLDRGE
jgi:HlyD family secretion protein